MSEKDRNNFVDGISRAVGRSGHFRRIVTWRKRRWTTHQIGEYLGASDNCVVKRIRACEEGRITVDDIFRPAKPRRGAVEDVREGMRQVTRPTQPPISDEWRMALCKPWK